MNVFFEVSKVQQIDLLNNWLSVYDVFNLDEAVCCHSLRPTFLELLASPECVLQHYDFLDEFRDTWAIARKVKFRSAYFSYQLLEDHSAREQLLEAIGKHLSSLQLSLECPEDDNGDEMPPLPTDQVLLDVSQYCPNVEDLTLSDTILDGTLSVVIKTSNYLRHLTLKYCTDISSSVVKAICSSQTLHSVYLSSCDFAHQAFDFIAKGCFTCRLLSISHCLMSDTQLKALVQHLPNLLKLSVLIDSGESLHWLCAALSKVQNVNILTKQCIEPADTVLFGQYWQELRELTIRLPSANKNETHLAACSEQCVLAVSKLKALATC